MNRYLRVLSLVFMLLFGWAALVQLNDPDAYYWIVIYAIPCIASLCFYFGKLHFLVGSILGIIYAIATFAIWPTTFEGIFLDEANIDNVERGREALGLLIIAIVMFFYAHWIRVHKRSKV